MKICAAQTNPVIGDIRSNISDHKKFIHQAISHGADIIIFPELSLTGYEPKMSQEWAVDMADNRLDDFQRISDSGQIAIGVGAPTINSNGICISMILFQPNKERQLHSKMYLHADEEEFFVRGKNLTGLKVKEAEAALAICYEISIPEHSEAAFNNGARIYLASVAKFVNGVDKAIKQLSDMAAKYSMTVVMSNCLGHFDGDEGAGRTSVWNKKGILAGQLDDVNEGIIIYDTTTQELIKNILSYRR